MEFLKTPTYPDTVSEQAMNFIAEHDPTADTLIKEYANAKITEAVAAGYDLATEVPFSVRAFFKADFDYSELGYDFDIGVFVMHNTDNRASSSFNVLGQYEGFAKDKTRNEDGAQFKIDINTHLSV